MNGSNRYNLHPVTRSVTSSSDTCCRCRRLSPTHKQVHTCRHTAAGALLLLSDDVPAAHIHCTLPHLNFPFMFDQNAAESEEEFIETRRKVHLEFTRQKILAVVQTSFFCAFVHSFLYFVMTADSSVSPSGHEMHVQAGRLAWQSCLSCQIQEEICIMDRIIN